MDACLLTQRLASSPCVALTLYKLKGETMEKL